MSRRPSTRQELYDRIRQSSKDEVIIEEMIRYGFWPKQSNLPNDPAEELRRIGELERRISALATEASRLNNVDAMRREARKRRMAEARARREETKRRHEAQRRARAEAWAAKKREEIVYLGEGFSGGLGQREGQSLPGLPDLQGAGALARAMEIEVGQLRWLAFHRRVSATTHYVRFQIPKKTGGVRNISAPMPRLKRAQRWIKEQILDKIELHEAAHGFVPGRSIVTNASAHVGRRVVINLDLQDFFPTLSFSRIYGVFRSFGYSPEASTLLALLCTEPEVAEVELDGRTWYVHTSERRLPQGAPSSPALTNIVARRLDRRLAGLAAHLSFTYTRYADDLTFSSDAADASIHRLIRAVEGIVSGEGFVVHPGKTRVMRRASRQEVTGLVVNDRLGVPRRLVRRWRATLFQVRRDGPGGKRFGLGSDVFASLSGFAAFVHMVDEARGARMLSEVAEVAAAHGWAPPPRRSTETRATEASSEASSEAPGVPASPSAGWGGPTWEWPL
ncbi:MAG TPA: RNA-directed DNA polymerase [Deltaproteobacteria bacterium]|nr:RNA-directed DNA polymerase [Deltaproteobacteria bacterium]